MNVCRALLILAMVASTAQAGTFRILERTTEPLLKADRPWEDYCIGYTQVIRDGGAWHMWYAEL